MLLLIRIITIVIAVACLAIGAFFIVAGLMEKPVADTGAVWMGIGIMVFYLADLFLLYRSYKKKHTPAHWVAFLLSVMPVIAVLLIVWLLDAL